VVYSTYLSGSEEVAGGRAIAVDAAGNAYVIGDTDSADFPTTPGAFQTTFRGGVVDAFVAKGAGAPATCPLGQGFWKNHPDAWPVSCLTLGRQTYSQTELLRLLDTPVRGDASLILAHQLIAAKLTMAPIPRRSVPQSRRRIAYSVGLQASCRTMLRPPQPPGSGWSTTPRCWRATTMES
jgi:hypothetical protein